MSVNGMGAAPELLGRDAETAAVARHVGAATERPAALVVTGDAGIGKTALWRDGLRRAADGGAAVLACRPGAAETRLAYSGLADLLAELAWPESDALPRVQRDALDVALVRRPAGSTGVSRPFRAGHPR